MARIDRHLRWLWMAILALAFVACDPYPAKNTAAPEIQAVYASNGDPYDLREVEGTKTDTGWTITIPGNFYEADPWQAPPFDQDFSGGLMPVIIVQTNQSLDDASIQTAPPTAANPNGDCIPMNSWLTVDPLPTGDDHWYSCYQPSAAVSFEGGAVVLFKAASPITAGSGGIGWSGLATLEVPETGPATSYSLSGTVKDRNSRDLTVSVVATVEPPPGQPGNPVLSFSVNALDATRYDATITWSATTSTTPTPTAAYVIQRADVRGDGSIVTAPVSRTGDWWNLYQTDDSTILIYKDQSLDPAVGHWYRVLSKSENGGLSRPTVGVPTVGQPGSPAYPSASAPSSSSYDLTVTWTEPASSTIPVARFLLQRALDSNGAPSPTDATFNGWTTVCTVSLGTTSCIDTGRDPDQAYWYQVVAQGDLGGSVSPVSPATDPTSAVPQLGVPKLEYSATSNTVTVSWEIPFTAGTLGVSNYRVDRAPDANGVPGTWSILDSGISAAATSYSDSTVTPSSLYWYRVMGQAAVGSATVVGPPTAARSIVTR